MNIKGCIKMKTIIALAALFCLLGMASAQLMFTGEGYGTSQLSFYNAPDASTFEPNVQNYWQDYIAGENATAKSTVSNMAIWMNTFPLGFNTPVSVSSSSFSAKAVAASNLSVPELNSRSLTRDVGTRFSIYETRAYTPIKSTFSVTRSNSVPSSSASGQIMSQNIVTMFNV